MASNTPEADAAHWNRTRNLTLFVLFLWAICAIAVHWFAAWLNTFSILGFPLGYFLAVQGSLVAFVALVFFQNWQQDETDDEFGQGDA